MLLSDKPEYNTKVRTMFELGPVGTAHWLRGVVRSLLWLDVTFEGVVRMYTTYLGAHEFGLHLPWLLTGVAHFFCPLANAELCRDAIFLAAGPPAKSFNWSRTPVYLANYFVSTSTWNMLHLGQNAVRNEVAHFDVSPHDNMRRYGSVIAPPYNYSNIDTDIYLFWSRNDWMTGPKEIERWLLPKMRPGVIKMLEWHSNPQDTALLRRTWTDDFEVLYSIGSNIYLNVFNGECGAAAKALFPAFARYEAEGLNYAEQSEFRIQALQLVQAMAKTLDKIEDATALELYLYQLGQRHIHYLPPRIDVKTWAIFKSGCTNPANKVSLKVGDAQGKQITFNYNVWTNQYSYAGQSVVGVLTPASSSANIQYVYEDDWKTAYINRPDRTREALKNITTLLTSLLTSVYTAEIALFNAGAYVSMRACSWTRFEEIVSGVRSLIYPTTGSLFVSPFRFSIRMGGPDPADPQAYR
ncbi:hypothetical protein PRIPAC_79284 [Pristionchus pacificus]|uniref:GLOBIN domain-containing protein n=1 Tax=Pristionchus pacificus TaxID=54126 RepID=A0A2A6CQ25_PRIPA|nr:hypothetical protein PRIPAC_79284 [Pristionchus pacificus]|eukprot:PDM80315.1 hypothetical protein PRIPAC_32894 [Pristionchus pacificus]